MLKWNRDTYLDLKESRTKRRPLEDQFQESNFSILGCLSSVSVVACHESLKFQRYQYYYSTTIYILILRMILPFLKLKIFQ